MQNIKRFFTWVIIFFALMPIGYAAGSFFQSLIVNQYISIGSNTAAHTSAALDISSTTKGMLPPRMTEVQRDAISSPATGLVVFNTTSNTLNVFNGTTWEEAGSGGGNASFVKWILNPAGEDGAQGWAAYADSGATPTDGIGGSPAVSVGSTTAAGTVYSNGVALACNKPSGNVQGQGCSYDFKIDAGMASKSQRIYMNDQFMTYNSSGSLDYISGDMGVWIYDKDAGTLQACNNDVDNLLKLNEANPIFSGATLFNKFQCSWFTNPGSDDYRLIYHQRTTNANAAALYHQITLFTDDTPVPGAIVTPWQSYTPTGSWTTNTSYTGFKRRVGDSEEYKIRVLLSGPPNSTALRINLPAGQKIDVNKSSTSLNNITLGIVSFLDIGTAEYQGRVQYFNDTSVEIRSLDANAALGLTNATTPFTFANGDSINITFSVPIQGWDAGAMLSTTELMMRGTDIKAVAGSQGISNVTWSTVSWGTEVRDTLAEFASNAFVPIATDKYKVVFRYSFAANAAGFRGVRIYNNTDAAVVDVAHFPPPSGPDTDGSYTFEPILTAGKSYVFQVFQSSGGALGFSGSSTASLSITRHFDPTVFGVYFEPVMASYYCSAARTGTTSAPFNFDTKEFDTHGAVTTGAAWKFTAPVPGTYEVSVLPAISSGSAQLYLYKNGSNYKNIGTIQDATQDVNLGVTIPIQLSKNDYIEIRPGTSVTIGGGSLTGTSISQIWIKRVGN